MIKVEDTVSNIPVFPGQKIDYTHNLIRGCVKRIVSHMETIDILIECYNRDQLPSRISEDGKWILFTKKNGEVIKYDRKLTNETSLEKIEKLRFEIMEEILFLCKYVHHTQYFPEGYFLKTELHNTSDDNNEMLKR